MLSNLVPMFSFFESHEKMFPTSESLESMQNVEKRLGQQLSGRDTNCEYGKEQTIIFLCEEWK